MCNEAFEEDPFPLRLLLDHFMLKFGHGEGEKKETGQYKMQEMYNQVVKEYPSSLRFIPIILKQKKCVKKPLSRRHGC